MPHDSHRNLVINFCVFFTGWTFIFSFYKGLYLKNGLVSISETCLAHVAHRGVYNTI